MGREREKEKTVDTSFFKRPLPDQGKGEKKGGERGRVDLSDSYAKLRKRGPLLHLT